MLVLLAVTVFGVAVLGALTRDEQDVFTSFRGLLAPGVHPDPVDVADSGDGGDSGDSGNGGDSGANGAPVASPA
jgi:hypothetical protein